MQKIFSKTYFITVLAFLSIIGFWVTPLLADSSRVDPESGYAVQDYVIDRVGTGYHGGLDIGYADVASGTAPAKTRCILKSENDGGGIGGNTLRVSLYDYTGKLISNFGQVTGLTSAWAQAVRMSPDNTEILYSYTDWGGGGNWYSIAIDPDTLLPVGSPAQPFSEPMLGNWEAEYDPESGEPFIAGKATQWGPDTHSIWVWNSNDSDWQEVVDVTGWSCGFTFDLDGNLWTGTYTSSGPMDVQYVRMYTADQIADAVANEEVLLPGDAEIELELPYDASEGWYMGANDLEVGADGTIYVTCNSGWTSAYDSEVGFVVSIENNGTSTVQGDMSTLSVSIPTDDSDWQKALAYDGESYIEDPLASAYTDPTQSGVTGNRLYIDQDTMANDGGSDIVTALMIAGDYDSDGVPDAIDNAPETINPDQIDADQDMYGNKVDADFDNNNVVNMSDFNSFVSYLGTNDPVHDMDSSGTVDMGDYSFFSAQYGKSAPFK